MDLRFIVHHHNCQRFRCECGALGYFNISDHDVGDHMEFACSCGRIHAKAKAKFSGDGKPWVPVFDLSPNMSPEEVRVLIWADETPKRRLLGSLYTIGLMLQQRGYLTVKNAMWYDLTEAGKAACRSLFIPIN